MTGLGEPRNRPHPDEGGSDFEDAVYRTNTQEACEAIERGIASYHSRTRFTI